MSHYTHPFHNKQLFLQRHRKVCRRSALQTTCKPNKTPSNLLGTATRVSHCILFIPTIWSYTIDTDVVSIKHSPWSNRLERWQTAVTHCVRQAFLLMGFLEGKWIVAICHQMRQLSGKDNKCNDVVWPLKIRPTQTRSDLSLQPSEAAFNMNESSYTSVHVLSAWCVFSTWCLTLILFDTCSLLVVVAAESCCKHGVKI